MGCFISFPEAGQDLSTQQVVQETPAEVKRGRFQSTALAHPILCLMTVLLLIRTVFEGLVSGQQLPIIPVYTPEARSSPFHRWGQTQGQESCRVWRGRGFQPQGTSMELPSREPVSHHVNCVEWDATLASSKTHFRLGLQTQWKWKGGGYLFSKKVGGHMHVSSRIY